MTSNNDGVDAAIKVPCMSDYCDPEPHPHEAPLLAWVPWIRQGFIPVCKSALDAMREDEAVQGLWAHYRPEWEERQRKAAAWRRQEDELRRVKVGVS